MNKKTVVLDLDGCLIDFISAYLNFVHSLGYRKIDPSEIKSFLFLQDVLGISKEESIHLFKKFTAMGGFRDMQTYPGTYALLEYLKEMDYRVVFATNVPTAGEKDRIANLADLNIKYDEMVFGPNKHEVANKNKAVLVLDDHPDAILTCREQCSPRTVVARPKWDYNAHITRPDVLCLGSHPYALVNLMRFLEKRDNSVK